MPKGSKAPPIPAGRDETLRDSLRAELRGAPITARELGARVGLREKDVLPHLEAIARGAKAHGETLSVEPPTCEKCGFVFETRQKVSRPSRCPSCKNERIRAARFSLE